MELTNDQLIDLVLKARNEDKGDSTHVDNAGKVVSEYLGTIKKEEPPVPPAEQPTGNITTLHLYRAPQQVDQHLVGSPELKVLQAPTAKWLGSWTNFEEIANLTIDAAKQNQVPVFAVYNIPNRDNGGSSAGGAQTEDAYLGWCQQVIKSIKIMSIIILEPDALALGLNMLTLSKALDLFLQAGHIVYIDAGHPNWLPAIDAAERLCRVGSGKAKGFALNTSNYESTEDCLSYGMAIGDKLNELGDNGACFVIDTSRNGNGNPHRGEWENVRDTKIGHLPQFVPDMFSTTRRGCDGFLWVKAPGESDGPTRGYPPAGQFSVDLAKQLVSGRWQ